MPVSMMVTVMHTEDVAVVGGTAGGIGENGIGLGEEGEGVRGVWVGRIGIRVVSLGEGVEGPNELSVRSSLLMSLIKTYFLISAGVASCRTFSRS